MLGAQPKGIIHQYMNYALNSSYSANFAANSAEMAASLFSG